MKLVCDEIDLDLLKRAISTSRRAASAIVCSIDLRAPGNFLLAQVQRADRERVSGEAPCWSGPVPDLPDR